MARIASVATPLLPFFFPIVTHAQLALTELMYDLRGGDAGHEWIEVQNVGATPIALTEWKLFEANSNHGLIIDGNDTLVPGQFAIIADDVDTFRADWPSYTGLIVDSSFSLSNTGETLALRCCGKEAVDRDTVSYTAESGAASDGNSLHRNGNGWSVGAPSPGSGGVPALLVIVPDSASQNTESSTEPNTPTSSNSKVGTMSVEAGGNRTALAKSEIVLSAKALTSKKEPIEQADFSWNFGDGSTGNGKSIMHAWRYPGTYQVTLRVSYDGETVDDRFIVEIIEPDFSVIAFDDGSVGIHNDGTREADISRWRIQEDGKSFVVPDGTVILKNALLRLSPETLGFIASRAALHYPDGALYARGEIEHADADTPAVSQIVVPPLKAVPGNTEEEVPEKPPAKHIPAPVAVTKDIVSDVSEQEQKSEFGPGAQVAAVSASWNVLSGAWYWWLAALGVSLVGAAGMLALRTPRDEWRIEDGDGVE